jgi:MFS family permease
VVVACAQFMVMLDVTVVNLALPRLAAGLHITGAPLAWVLDAYTLTFGGLLLLGGRIGDLTGHRRTFVTGVTVFTLASLACGLAHTSGFLIAARAVQGIGAATVSPAALAIMTMTFTAGRDRQLAFAIWGGLGGLGATIGVVLGGLVVDLLGWRWVFLLNLPMGAAVLAAAWLIPSYQGLLRRHNAREGAGRRPRADVPGAVTVTGGLLLLVYAIIAARADGWLAPVTLGCAAASALLLAGFWRIERGAPAPLLPARVLRMPTLVVGSTGEVLIGATELSAMYLISMQAQRVVGMTPLAAGLGFLPIGVVAVAAAVLTAPLSQRFGARRLYTFGCLAGLAGLGLFALLYGYRSYLAGMLGPGLLIGLTVPVVSIVCTVVATSGVAAADSGIASGVFNSSFEIGSSLGLAVTATVATTGLRNGYLAALSFSVLGLVNAAFGFGKLAPTSVSPAPAPAEPSVR